VVLKPVRDSDRASRTATEEARRGAAAHRRTRHRNLQPLSDNVLTSGPVEGARAKQTPRNAQRKHPPHASPEVPGADRIVEPNVVEPILATR
jgi:hypothetical protein